MSSTNPPTSVPPSSLLPSSGGVKGEARESSVRLISHSNLFYWWPVWFLSFLMAAVTYVENHRLAIVPAGGSVNSDGGNGTFTLQFPAGKTTRSLADAERRNGTSEAAFPARISQQSWVGAVFVVGLLLTIVVTNVPLRGLWAFMVLMSVIVVALLISLLGGWDRLFDWAAGLHIHINMAGYLFIGVATFILWALAVFLFDQRSYIVFTPGQIRYCEHIWDSVKVFPAAGAVIEKQRDDLFRHYVLGFFSGDLIVRVGQGADRHELKLPNVLGLGFKLPKVEDMLRRVEVQ